MPILSRTITFGLTRQPFRPTMTDIATISSSITTYPLRATSSPSMPTLAMALTSVASPTTNYLAHKATPFGMAQQPTAQSSQPGYTSSSSKPYTPTAIKSPKNSFASKYKTKGYISHQYVAFYFFYPQITRISQIYFLFIKLVGFVGKKSMSFVGGNPPNDDGVFLLLKYTFSPIVPIVFGSLLNLRI